MWEDAQYEEWFKRGQTDSAYEKLDDGDIYEKLKREVGGK